MYCNVLNTEMFADAHLQEPGNIDVHIQNNDAVEMVEHQETEMDKKRKRSKEEDDVHQYL